MDAAGLMPFSGFELVGSISSDSDLLNKMKGKNAVAFSNYTQDSGIVISITNGSVTLVFRLQWTDWFEEVKRIRICLIWSNTTFVTWGTINCNV